MADVATRAKRADEVRTERRKKPGNTTHYGMKLDVPKSMLDTDTYVYRWANDKGNRIQQLMDEDYDPAPELADGASNTTKVVGTNDGKPYSAMLMRKRKDWYSADQKEKHRLIDEIDAQIKGGTVHEKDEPTLRQGTYTPGKNSIGPAS